MGKFPPEDYERVGFDYGGYLEPEVTTNDEYPDYLKQEAKETIDAVRALQGFKTATFAFITDPHYTINFKLSHQIRFRRLMNTYKDIESATACDFLAIGGDIATNGSKQYMCDCITALRQELGGVRYFPVNGNHDGNDIWDIACVYQKPAINHLLPEERYNLFFNHAHREGAVFNQKAPGLYYYVDNKFLKLRYIFLDCCDVPFEHNEDGSLKYMPQGFYSYSQAQLDWLAEEALCFDEDGWTVVVFQHVPTKVNYKTGERYDRVHNLHDILLARRENAKCNAVYNEGELHTEVNTDFSTYKKCDIAAVFVGHIHTDSELVEDGIHYISTANSVMYMSDPNIKRADGDKTELLMDVITINTDKRTVNLTRVGAGEDRSFNY